MTWGHTEVNLQFARENKVLQELHERSSEWQRISKVWHCQANATNILAEKACDVNVRLEAEVAALKSFLAKLEESGQVEW